MLLLFVWLFFRRPTTVVDYCNAVLVKYRTCTRTKKHRTYTIPTDHSCFDRVRLESTHSSKLDLSNSAKTAFVITTIFRLIRYSTTHSQSSIQTNNLDKGHTKRWRKILVHFLIQEYSNTTHRSSQERLNSTASFRKHSFSSIYGASTILNENTTGISVVLFPCHPPRQGSEVPNNVQAGDAGLILYHSWDVATRLG